MLFWSSPRSGSDLLHSCKPLMRSTTKGAVAARVRFWKFVVFRLSLGSCRPPSASNVTRSFIRKPKLSGRQQNVHGLLGPFPATFAPSRTGVPDLGRRVRAGGGSEAGH